VLQPASAIAAAIAADAKSARTKGRRFNRRPPNTRLPQAFPRSIATPDQRPQQAQGWIGD
jgi:hypothetical protein